MTMGSDYYFLFSSKNLSAISFLERLKDSVEVTI